MFLKFNFACNYQISEGIPPKRLMKGLYLSFKRGLKQPSTIHLSWDIEVWISNVIFRVNFRADVFSRVFSQATSKTLKNGLSKH